MGETYPDTVNFGPRDTVPEKFKDRLFYQHNPTVTLMRTTVEENARIGEDIRRKVAASTGPAAIMLPLNGVSTIDVAGQAFDDPNTRNALFDAIRHSRGQIELEPRINDAEFAEAAAHRLIDIIKESCSGNAPKMQA